jgi:hypothetical protein
MTAPIGEDTVQTVDLSLYIDVSGGTTCAYDTPIISPDNSGVTVETVGDTVVITANHHDNTKTGTTDTFTLTLTSTYQSATYTFTVTWSPCNPIFDSSIVPAQQTYYTGDIQMDLGASVFTWSANCSYTVSYELSPVINGVGLGGVDGANILVQTDDIADGGTHTITITASLSYDGTVFDS